MTERAAVSLFEVQKLVGHSNIAVMQVYSHLQPKTLHSTVNRISLVLNGDTLRGEKKMSHIQAHEQQNLISTIGVSYTLTLLQALPTF